MTWPPELMVRVPGWARSKSGLYLPTEKFRPEVSRLRLPPIPGTEIEPQFGIVLRNLPSALDQMRVTVEEAELGLPSTTERRRKRFCARLDFEIGMIVLSRLIAHLAAHEWSAVAQAHVAHLMFTRRDRLERGLFALRHRRQLFPEPHLVALQRLLILHGSRQPLDSQFERDCQSRIFERAILSMSGLAGSRVRADDAEDTPKWLAYLTQNGAYNSHDPLSETMSRVYGMFVELASSPEMRAHPQYVPIERWLREDHGQMGVGEQFGVGLMTMGRSNANDAGVHFNQRALMTGDLVDRVADQLHRDPKHVDALLTADRAWYREQFVAAGEDDQHAAWDRIPFEKRPLLRLSDGNLLLLSPRALNAWMTDGFFYRALDCAIRHGEQRRFRQFYAALAERYIFTLMREAHQDRGNIGVGVVHGEYQSRRGIHTPDVMIDLGTDLVLMEVVTKRLTLGSTVTGDPGAVAADLEQMVAQKARQLSNRIDDLHAGHIHIPGVTLQHVHRIWPIVVVPGGLLQTPHLWDFIDQATPTHLQQRNTQHLTILDFTDVEFVAALIEAGHSLPSLLVKKMEGYARRDLAAFVNDDFRVPRDVRFSGVRRRINGLWLLAGKALGLNEDELRGLREMDEHDEQAA